MIKANLWWMKNVTEILEAQKQRSAKICHEIYIVWLLGCLSERFNCKFLHILWFNTLEETLQKDWTYNWESIQHGIPWNTHVMNCQGNDWIKIKTNQHTRLLSYLASSVSIYKIVITQTQQILYIIYYSAWKLLIECHSELFFFFSCSNKCYRGMRCVFVWKSNVYII